jgi:hypothetical protein
MGRRPAKVLELGMPFEEALRRFTLVDPTELLGKSLRSKKLTRGEPKRRKVIPNATKAARSKVLKNGQSARAASKKKGPKS